jgi:phospholipase/carboxylesterase
VSLSDLPSHVARPPAGEPEGTLALFHGRGADEHDLLPLLDMLDPERRLYGVTARAPLSLPPGGAHWYVVRRVGYPDRETFHATFERLASWIEGLVEETGVPLERTVLGGFSQGAVMSYALALGAGRPAPAAILALSGFIPEVEGFDLDLSRRRGLPVAIGHGSYDPVIGVEFGRAARDELEAAGLDVTYRESPMAHTIDPAYIDELRREWMPRVLARVSESSER